MGWQGAGLRSGKGRFAARILAALRTAVGREHLLSDGGYFRPVAAGGGIPEAPFKSLTPDSGPTAVRVTRGYVLRKTPL
jgi:hypothetical protein